MNRVRQALTDLLDWGENPEGSARLRMTEALDQAREALTPQHEAIHGWFGLTYANYLVLPRAVLQSMPDDWQTDFCNLLDELYLEFGQLDWPAYDVRVLTRPTDWITPYETCPDCEGTGRRRWRRACETCEGEGEIEGERRYETPEEVGFRTDPIPHYNRGRTRLERRASVENAA